jgi:geranylgeranyl diphosphate synthase, type II
MNFTQQLKEWQNLINQSLDHFLPNADLAPPRLHKAMRYSMEVGGKRLRPILALAAHELFPSSRDPIPAALAIECIHTYSLIHDDLPAMDDSNLRRGQPACHKAFDEATAILAGDAFQPLAFEILSKGYVTEPALALELTAILAKTAGSEQLVGGQMQDLISEGKEPDEETLSYIHANKTAAMIRASLQMGFLLGTNGGDASKADIVSQAGLSLGLAFQAVDDLLDVTRSTKELGKDASHDQNSGKITWVTLKGIEEARQLAEAHTESARQSIVEIGGNNEFLLQLIDYMLARKN